MKIIFSEEITALAAASARETMTFMKRALKAGEEINSLHKLLFAAASRAKADDKAAATDEAAALRVAGANLQAEKLAEKISSTQAGFDSICKETYAELAKAHLDLAQALGKNQQAQNETNRQVAAELKQMADKIKNLRPGAL